HALVIPKTIDNRILFILPWRDKVVVGTTDIAVTYPELEPTAQDEEIEFILATLNQYTVRNVDKSDIKSVFTGQRPLVRPKSKVKTAKISRKHEILYSESGLITIVGGKWTIYRLMGEDTINFAVKHKLLIPSTSRSKQLKLFGYTTDKLAYPLSVYGTDINKIHAIQTELNNFAPLHPDLPYYEAEVVYQVRYEMAVTIEDVLARRTRALLLDAKAALTAAPKVAQLMAQELGKNQEWENNQLAEFTAIAAKYIVE
ncbi:MAG: glycerol-3-phosphate dehydrogenase C-terminal domain-containing protein, partial [Burkholderiales bacterium]